MLDGKKAGDAVKVEVLRGSKKMSVNVTLGERVLGQAE